MAAKREVGSREGATGSADVRRLVPPGSIVADGVRVASLADRANETDPSVRPFSAIGELSRRDGAVAAAIAGDGLRRGEGIVELGMRGVRAWVVELVDAVESGDDEARDGARGAGSALDRRAAIGEDLAMDAEVAPRRAGLEPHGGDAAIRRAGEPKR